MIGDRLPSPAIAHLGEHELISRIRRRAGNPPDWIAIGIGDDAAVLRSSRNTDIVVTTDAQVEGVHFRRDWTSMAAIGRKAVAVNLSDLAAMGATPRACLLSLALPGDLSVDDFDALVNGVVELSQREKAPLVGGNITRSPGPLFVDVTAIGAVHGRRLLTRRGGRAGDLLFVSGEVGGAGAALSMLAAGVDRSQLDEPERECLTRLEQPEPRLRLGHAAGRSRAVTACIDLSDGLAEAVRQLAQASGTGATIDAAKIPVQAGARQWAARQQADPIDGALGGGEDYELLFAVAPRRRRAFFAAISRRPDVPVTHVGQLTATPEVLLTRDGTLHPLPSGFRHF